MARTQWPASLKLRPLRTRAGRRLASRRSTNGKGTTTRSPGPQITEGFVVGWRRPFPERLEERGVKLGVERFHAPDRRHAVTNLVGHEVPGLDPEPVPDLLGDRYLPLYRELAGKHVQSSYLFTVA